MKLTEIYKQDFENSDRKFFIIDSGKHDGDKDFEAYTWRRSINNKISEGDFFIYRKSKSVSTTGKFYLFGSGKFGKITGNDEVSAEILEPQEFEPPIMQDELDQFDWQSKQKGKDWSNFWNQYGINLISKKDFIELLNLVDGDGYTREDGQKTIEYELKIASGNYFVADSEALTKTRPWQAAWSKKVKENFGYMCAICGLTTPELLVGSHIVPVKDDEDNRMNPSNGICLCVLHDKMFDKGLISVNSDMVVQIANVSDDHVLETLLQDIRGLRVNNPRMYKIKEDFIQYHNDNIFKSGQL